MQQFHAMRPRNFSLDGTTYGPRVGCFHLPQSWWQPSALGPRFRKDEHTGEDPLEEASYDLVVAFTCG